MANITTPIHSIHDVAAAMRGRRTDLGLSQAELAKRAGVSRKWVYEFEDGKPTAEFGLLLRVLDVLDLQLALSTTSGDRQAWEFLGALIDEHRG